MKNVFIVCLLSIALYQSLFAQKKQISLEDICINYKFYSASPEGFNFMKDGQHFTRLETSGIVKFDIKTGKDVTVIYSNDNKVQISDYSFSEDEKYILMETNPESIYRHSTKADYFLYDVIQKKEKNLSENGKQRNTTLSPDAKMIAFVKDNNLFLKEISTGKETQITKDGKENSIINGVADWVYEEEFSFTKAFYFSPDASKIAWLRFDESAVKEFTMTYYTNELYPNESKFKYPKAGEKNADVTVFVYDLKSKKKTQIEVGGDKDQYIPRLKWTPANELCIFRLNRRQNELNILKAEHNGKTKVMFTEKNNCFIDINDHMTFVDKDKFLWMSEADGFKHIYLYGTDGKLIRQLTKGEWDVTNFYGYDAKNNLIYFQAAAEKSYNREVYSVSINGGSMKKLSSESGENDAVFSSDFRFYINEYSNLKTPPVFKVFETEKNTEIRIEEENKSLKELMKQYEIGEQNYFSFKNDDGIELNGWMMLPADFDASKKYPVFMYVYGGPGSPTATNHWDNGNANWFRMLTQKGYIVVTVDGRGTEPRGEKFRKVTYLQLGKYEASDQISAGKYLGNLPYVDKNRIGIFGWSFGGYLSSLCLAKGNDVFKMAIAVAPVTNWKWYDTIYTERYMRTPAENMKGYEENSPINFAANIKGKYLLVHGFGDDNVHFQHAVEMSRVLVEKNIPFEQMFYPNKNHGIYGGLTRMHLYTKMTDFILKNL
jgi:dipeptidyl-peptidase-4